MTFYVSSLVKNAKNLPKSVQIKLNLNRVNPLKPSLNPNYFLNTDIIEIDSLMNG